MMKILNSILKVAAVGTIGLMALYYVAPNAYAKVAYKFLPLPITHELKSANPDAWFDYQSRLLQSAEGEMEVDRKKLAVRRIQVERNIQKYNKKIENLHSILLQAKKAAQVNPSASSYQLLTSTYTPAAFSTTVQGIDASIKTMTRARNAMKQAKGKVENSWIKLAQNEAKLDADKINHAVNWDLWKTDQLLSGLDQEYDWVGYESESQETLRTVDELLEEAENMQIDTTTEASEGDLISPAAKVILGLQ